MLDSERRGPAAASRKWWPAYRYRSDCPTAPAYWLLFALSEPREFAYVAPRRIACRLLHRHNVTCRGRTDHPRS